MLAMAATPATVSASSRRRGRSRSRPGAGWQPRRMAVAQLPRASPTVTPTMQQDAVTAELHALEHDADVNYSEDDVLLQSTSQCTPPRRGVVAAFLRLALPDSDDSDEDYSPSDDASNASDSEFSDAQDEHEAASGFFAPYTGASTAHDSGSGSDTSSSNVTVDGDRRWWDSQREKKRWAKRYRAADAAFRRRFGCGIDTPAQPELRRRLHSEKRRHGAYTLVLGALVLAYLAQLAMVYSASSWAFSMVSWQPQEPAETGLEGIATDTTVANVGSSRPGELAPTEAVDTVSAARLAVPEVPEYVRTGLQLCASLSRRVVKSQHDVTATGHALRACEIAVKFAPRASHEEVEAHVLRGDLRSLLSRFDGAAEDYEAALAVLDQLKQTGRPVERLERNLELKAVANRWTQLYKSKSFKELRREAKARATGTSEDSERQEDAASELSTLASDWLQVLKRQKPVLDVITQQRSFTLRRLEYATQDDAPASPEPRDE